MMEKSFKQKAYDYSGNDYVNEDEDFELLTLDVTVFEMLAACYKITGFS